MMLNAFVGLIAPPKSRKPSKINLKVYDAAPNTS